MKILIFINIILLLLISCSPDISGGVEEGNVVAGISGTVISPEGDTLSNVIVELCFFNSSPLKLNNFCYKDTTDKNGKFSFTELPSLTYKLSSFDENGSIITDSFSYNLMDTIKINLKLKNRGVFNCTLPVNAKEDISYYIPGTSYTKTLKAGENKILFANLPEGFKDAIINSNNGKILIPDSPISVNDTINIKLMSILFIYDSDTTSENSFNYQRSVIKNLGIKVISLPSTLVNDSIINNVSAVYISYIADTSTSLVSLLNLLSTPLIVGNYNFFPLLHLTDTAADTGINYGTETSTNALIYYNKQSPITEYFNPGVTQDAPGNLNLGGPGKPIWGVPLESATTKSIIISSRDNYRCHLFTYEENGQTFGGITNKRVVAIFMGNISTPESNNKLLEGSTLWAAGYL